MYHDTENYAEKEQPSGHIGLDNTKSLWQDVLQFSLHNEIKKKHAKKECNILSYSYDTLASKIPAE